MKYDPQWYGSPIDIPECSSGKVRVRHRIIQTGKQVDIVGVRQAFLRGRMPIVGVVKNPLRIHELSHSKHGVWMTDMPEELNQIAELMYEAAPAGRVLAGGLGLGILAQTLAARQGVNSVTVVENDKDVVKLCGRTDLGYRLALTDIARFLTTTKECFDYYMLDTWQGTNEGTWWRSVMPLRRVIRQRNGERPVIHCWAEDIMVGQIVRTLTSKPPHWLYTGLDMPMTPHAAHAFVDGVGLPWWERRYGDIVDENMKQRMSA